MTPGEVVAPRRDGETPCRIDHRTHRRRYRTRSEPRPTGGTGAPPVDLCLWFRSRATLAGVALPVPASVLALGGSDCEALHEGLLGQPANGVSSLAYVVAAGYVLRRGGPAGPALALALVGVGSVLYHGPMTPGAELVHDGSLIAVPLAAIGVAARRRTFPRPPAAALVALAAGVAVNVLSRTGAPLCRPDSLLQGHAVWHVLTAAGAALWLARWQPRPDPRTGCGSDVHDVTTTPGSAPDVAQPEDGVDADSAGITSAP
jgi:hypothetical protein